MTKYYCERCRKEFSQKSHYDSHKRRKKICENHNATIQTLAEEKVFEIMDKNNLKNDALYVKAFTHLYKFLQKYNETNITNWLNTHWDGKDKQDYDGLTPQYTSVELIIA